MKRNKIMALAMLCSTFLSPVSKAHGGTKQGTEKSDTQSDSDKNSQDIKNKKSDNPKEMYESRWKTDDIVKYIDYFFGTVIGGKIVYNKYIRNPKIKVIEPKEVELSRELVAKKIKARLDSSIDALGENSGGLRQVYKQVIESYESQKNDEFQKIIKTGIPNDKQKDEQFITWFQELNNDALDILLKDFSDEEKQFAKDNFKFYSFVWVEDASYIVIAFAPKEKQINLEGAKGKEAFNFDDKQLFGKNFNSESYEDILKYCEINKK